MASFADYYPIQCLLEIAHRHRDAVDSARVREDTVIGQDNWDNLAVSTVFSAIAIEAALNDYTLSHCLFLDFPYLQEVFGRVTKQFLRSSVHNKIDLLAECWPDDLTRELLNEVRELIRIRNRITHQTGEFKTANETDGQGAVMSNHTLTSEEICHSLRHYEIARNFLSCFWLPGNRELQHQPRSGGSQ